MCIGYIPTVVMHAWVIIPLHLPYSYIATCIKFCYCYILISEVLLLFIIT